MQNNQSDMQYGPAALSQPPLPAASSVLPVSVQRLKKMAAKAGQHYSLACLQAGAGNGKQVLIEEEAATVLDGQVVMQDAGDALMVHTTDAVADKDWVAEIDLPAGLIFCFVDDGELRFKLDGKDYHFDAGANHNIDTANCNRKCNSKYNNNCFLLQLNKPARLTRYIVAGIKTKKLNVTVSRTWLARHLLSGEASDNNAGKLLSLPLAHGEVLRWQAGAALTQAALQLLRCSQQTNHHSEGSYLLADNSPLGCLLLQGQATQCLALALNEGLQLQQKAACSAPKSNAIQQRFMTIVERYVHNAGDATILNAASGPVNNELNIRNIAKELGMSVSAVQRLAKQVLGDSVVNYIRSKKLDIARKALESGSMTIGEVAYQAGYKHSSNFAIAFKKAFGISPGALQSE